MSASPGVKALDVGTEAIIFDLDDTLVVEEDSAHAAFLAVCRHAAAACGVDAQNLCDAVRAATRALWVSHPHAPIACEWGSAPGKVSGRSSRERTRTCSC